MLRGELGWNPPIFVPSAHCSLPAAVPTMPPMHASQPTRPGNSMATQCLLNIGHAIDHMFLLIFATAVTSIAADFGIGRWEDLMPYSVAAFFFFGIGSLPSGRL